MSNNIFQRTEKKYVLRQEQFCNLQIGINKRMKQDEYGHHTICNIYFDTDCFDLIRTSLEKPLYKEKLRIRSYGIPTENGKVFLELKKKYDGVVYKRRQECSWKDAKRYLILNEQLRQSTQILNEIDWFKHYYQPTPKAFLSYERDAWYGTLDQDLRVTFDRNILGRGSELDFQYGIWGSEILPKNKILMEIKTSQAIPLWLCILLEENEIYPTSFSKYGKWYEFHSASFVQLGGVINA